MKARLNRLKLAGICAVAAAFVAAALAVQSASAAVLTWNNGSGDLTWSATSSSLDWTGLPWTDGSDALFAGSGVGAISISDPVTPNSITFNASGYTISGNALTIGAGGINASALSSDTIAISSPIKVATGFQRWTVGAGATLSLGTIGSVSGDPADTYGPAGAIVVISKTGTVTTTVANGWGWRAGGPGLLGPGMVIDNGDNTYDWAASTGSGPDYTIAAATYTAAGSGDKNNVKVTSNTTVSVNASWASLLVSGATFTANGSNLYMDTGIILENGATINGSAPLKANSDGLYVYTPDSGTISSSIQNNGSNVRKLYKAGAGNLTLSSNNNTYTGGTVVYGGTLSLSSGGGSGAVRNTLTINPGTTVKLTAGDALGYNSGANATPINIVGGTLDNAIAGNNGYITTFNLTGGTMMNSVANTGTQGFNFNGSSSAINSLASSTVSTISAPVVLRGNGLTITTAKGTVASGIDLDISGAIISNGGGGITKAGAGLLELSGSNTYTGGTTINGGTLTLGPAGTLGSGNLSIASGSLLDVSAYGSGYNINGGVLTAGRTSSLATDINGSISVNNTSVNLPGSNATLTVSGSLAMSGATFNYNAGDKIALSSGALSLSSTDYIAPLAPMGTGSFTLFTTPAGGVSPSATANLAMAGANGSSPRQSYTFDASSGSAIILNVNGQAGNLFWTGAGNGVWFTGAGTQNWYNRNKPGGPGADVFYASDAVTFSDSGSSPQTVTISGTVQPGLMTVSNTAVSYIFSGTGSIVGGSPLVVNGPGSLTINNSNTYSGGTNLAGGLLNLSNSAALGTGPLTLSGGSLDNATGSAMTLGGNTQNWNGGFTFVGSSPLDMGAGAVTLSASSTVAVNANTLTVSSAINGTGALAKNGPGILVLTGNNGYGGGTTISGGTLQIGNGGATGNLPAGSVVNNAALLFNLNGNLSTDGNLNVSGTGSVTVMMSGGNPRLHFSGSNTYSGPTTITSGSVVEVNASSAYSQNSDYTVNGTMESYNNLPSATIGALNGSGNIYNTGDNSGTTPFTVGANGDSGDFSGSIRDGAWGSHKTALTKSGSGTQVISGTNAYTGNTTVNQGILTISPSGQVYTNGGNGSMYISSGGLVSFSGGIGWTYAGGPYAAFGGMTPEAGHLVIDGGTLQHTGPSNAQNVQPGAGRVFTVGANGATLDSVTAGQMFSLGFRYDYNGGVITSNAGGNLTLSGVGDGQLDFALPGSGGVIKSGTGTWILSGPNSYTGGTTINGGVLQMAINGTRIGSLGNQGPLTMSGGTLDLNGVSQTVGELAGTGGVITATSPATLNSISSTYTTFSGVLVGSVSLAVTGGGLTLGGANTHTGGSTFNGVSVALLPTGKLGPGVTNLNGGSTLDVSAFSSGYPLNQGILATDAFGANVTGSLVVGSATLAPLGPMYVSGGLSLNGATFDFTPGDVITAGALSFTGTNYIAPTTTLTAGTQYELFDYSGAAPVTTGLQLTGQFASGRQHATFTASSGVVDLTVSSGSAGVLIWQGTSAHHNWDVQTSSDWLNTNTNAADRFYNGDLVTFDDTAAPTGGTVTIVGTVKPGSLTVSSNTINYTFAGTGSIGNGTSLNMSGASTLTIATSNSYSGGTTLANGVINANSPYALGVGSVSVISGTLNLTAGTSSGTGPITLSGGVVNASAPLTPSSVTLSGGQINVNNPRALGSGILTINAGSTLDNTSSGSVVSTTNNQQQWNGDFTFGGSSPLDLGSGLINLNNTVTVTVSGSTLSAEGAISAAADGVGLNVAGSGTLSLGGVANNGGGSSQVNVQGATLSVGPSGRLNTGNYGATMNVTSGGKLRVTGGVGWNSTLGLANLDPSGLVLDGGTFTHYGDSNAQDQGPAGRLFTIGANGATLESETPGQTFSLGFRTDHGSNLTSDSGGTLTLAGAGDGVLDYNVPGAGGLLKTGTGTWTLMGVNTYMGGTTVLGGTLVLSNSGAIADGSSLTVGDPSAFSAAPIVPPMNSAVATPAAGAVALSAVPEPGSLTLVAVGATVAVGCMWRRRKFGRTSSVGVGN